MSWWRHAFAVDPPGPAIPSDIEQKAVDAILKEVIRRRLTAPAVLFLESAPSLNYVAAQAMHFFAPFAHVLVAAGWYDAFAGFLEQRGSIEYMIQRLHALHALQEEAEHRSADSKAGSKLA